MNYILEMLMNDSDWELFCKIMKFTFMKTDKKSFVKDAGI